MQAMNHSWGMNHGERGATFPEGPKRCCERPSGGNTDLLGEEGHDGEDNQRHEDAVRPKLQLVPVHPPEDGEEEKTNVSQLRITRLSSAAAGISRYQHGDKIPRLGDRRVRGGMCRRWVDVNCSDLM